ncbi:MAG: hypothetical protein H6970_03775 [Gammaproteobacteria bacterium]|nr:hypothetical protein [Gammaproteobacteria bacterium]MCP5424169.1 hypothetical protein [Gammaproteobacteria bacterium]
MTYSVIIERDRFAELPLDSTSGIEPIQDGACRMVLDGYLTNRDELCKALAIAHERDRISDAALALRIWKQEGCDGLFRLQGPFVLLLTDRDGAPEQARIVLYREPFGRRCLYYFSSSKYLLAASEPSALLAHPAVSHQPDDIWLAQHFAFSRPVDNHTPFQAIRKLLPGECVVYTAEAVTCQRTPLTLGRRPLRYRHDVEYAEHFRELLDQAIARRLTDTGEQVGIMLSGGMDSGPLAALAQRRLHDSGGTLTAYSWSLPDCRNADESAAITACADYVGCRLKLLPGMMAWPMRNLPAWPVNPNSPTANCYRLLKSRVYRAAAADGCRVLLNGAAGDLLYPNPAYLLLESWRDGRYRTILTHIARRLRHQGPIGVWRDPATRRLGKYVLAWPDRPATPPDWLTSDARRHWRTAHEPWPPESIHHPRPDHFQSALGQWAADGDSEESFFASRCGIEILDPFRDPDLVDFMLSLPSYHCFRNGHTKWLARQSMKGWLPESIRWRPRSGLLNEFFDFGYQREHNALRQLLSAPDAAWPAYVDHDWLMRVFDDPASGEMEKLLVWYCAAFELWRLALSGEHPALLQFANGTIEADPTAPS